MVRGLISRGHEVRVLHPVRDGERPRYSLEEVEAEGVPVTLLANAGDPAKRFAPSYLDERVDERFREVLNAWKPDLVHFTYLLWGLSVRLPRIARELGIPSTLTLTDYGLVCHRGQMFDTDMRACGGPQPPSVCAGCIRTPAKFDQPPLARALRSTAAWVLAKLGGLQRVVVEQDLVEREREVRATLDVIAHVIAPTDVIATPFRALGVEAERLTVMPYAFDETPYAEVRASAPPAVPRFVFFGQFAPHKGLDVLMDAADRLQQTRGDQPWEIVLYGGGSVGRHRLFAPGILARLDGQRVRVGEPFGPGEAPGILRASTALVVPSLWDENAPLAVLEARASGVPVIASSVRGIAEVVEHERHGLLFPPGDSGALAALFERVLDHGLARTDSPGLPVSLPAHLDRLEAIHRRALEPR